MCASAILPVTIGSSPVTSVCGSWDPCSNSTSMPNRNCSSEKRLQSTPISSPTRLASSFVVRRVSVMSSRAQDSKLPCGSPRSTGRLDMEDEAQIHGRIEQLVAEERELWERESAGNASDGDGDRQRLQ